MKIRSIKVPPSERFCATPRAIKSALSDFEDLSVYLGVLGKSFRFDSQFRHRPTLGGPVVASIGISRERHTIMQLYVVERRSYPDLAAAEFEGQVLPRIRQWLTAELAKPETAVFGYESMIYVWAEGTHRELLLPRH